MDHISKNTNIHDVSGDQFVPGVTNFHLENVYDALEKAGLINQDNSDFTVVMPLTVYFAQVWSNLIDDPDMDHCDETDYTGKYQSMTVRVKPATRSSLFESICDTELVTKDGNSVILRTREF